METKIWNAQTGRRRLLDLIREKAYSEGKEFTLASGKKSRFYINCKTVTLDPEGLWLLSHLICDTLAPRKITALGGLTLGADPIAAGAAAVSYSRQQPLKAFIVRKEAKGHGAQKQIEGMLTPQDRICVVEDVVTTGGSTKKALEAIEAAGLSATSILTIVDREDEDAAWLRQDPRFTALFRLSELK